MRPPPGRLAVIRWLLSARLRRWLVYALAATLAIIVGGFAARLARPPDPYGEVHVEALPGVSEGAHIEGVRHDPQTGRTWLDVRERDGTLLHYVLGEDSGLPAGETDHTSEGDRQDGSR